MGNSIIRIRIKNVQSVDSDFEMIKDIDKYIHLYSTPIMIEHLSSKPDYYGLKCEEYSEHHLICRYASVTMDPFYDTDIILSSSPERIKEIVHNRKYKLQCVPDSRSMEWITCTPESQSDRNK